jgi:hypothetical protein
MLGLATSGSIVSKAASELHMSSEAAAERTSTVDRRLKDFKRYVDKPKLNAF